MSQDISIPERNVAETPPVYLSRLFGVLSKGVVASLLARNGDPFHLEVLKAYMQTFDFHDDPMDMALRKLLMEVELPSETQQIDRVLQAFADRYHECNPAVYQDSGEPAVDASVSLANLARPGVLHCLFAHHAPHRLFQQKQQVQDAKGRLRQKHFAG